MKKKLIEPFRFYGIYDTVKRKKKLEKKQHEETRTWSRLMGRIAQRPIQPTKVSGSVLWPTPILPIFLRHHDKPLLLRAQPLDIVDRVVEGEEL
jgi:hypothetical protein